MNTRLYAASRIALLKIEYLDALRDVKRELNSNSDKKLLYRILNDRDVAKLKKDFWNTINNRCYGGCYCINIYNSREKRKL